MKHSELTKHFPAWFGPDVFDDSWDLLDFSNSYDNKVLNANKNKPKDPINIFKSCRKVFSELLNYEKKEKVEIMLDLNVSEGEDIFRKLENLKNIKITVSCLQLSKQQSIKFCVLVYLFVLWLGVNTMQFYHKVFSDGPFVFVVTCAC